VEDYRAALDTAARLGARNALVAGNDPDEARLSASFAAFCDLAGEYGITANLEPMPWTDVRNVAEGARVLRTAARDNGALLIDAIHFDRGRSSLADVAAVPVERLRYVQICDAPAARPGTMQEILFQARAERLLPGEGGLDLRGLLHALPPWLPISLEIPNRKVAATVPALERARRAMQALQTLIAPA